MRNYHDGTVCTGLEHQKLGTSLGVSRDAMSLDSTMTIRRLPQRCVAQKFRRRPPVRLACRNAASR